MALKRKASNHLQYSKDVDFRCPTDDAWHIVKLAKVEGVLRVMYVNFLDELYYSDQFESLDEIEELLGRLRLPAKQLQDSQCGQVTEGMVVLASHDFQAAELLFRDAMVDSVSRSELKADDGTKEKECTCKFNLKWKHGPRMGKNDTVGIEHICLIEELPVEDPVLEDFIDGARKSLEERIENLVNQGGSSGVNPATSHGASQCPTNLLELIDVDHSDGSPHHQVDDVIGQTGDSIGTLGEEKDALEDRCSQAEAEVARLKAKIADMEEQARAASAWQKEKSELERKVDHLEEVLAEELYFQKETERYEGLLQEEQARAKAEVARLKAEQAHAASSWEKEKSELERKVEHLEEVLFGELYFQKETERYKGLLQEEQARAEAEVARLKAEQAHAASSWEKEKSELERKVEHLEEVLAEELYFRKETERNEGLLQELNAQLQIFKAQMQVAKAEREQAILALYEIEAKLKGKRYKVGMSASEWKIPEHLTLPPSETVLSTIRNSQAFAPFRRQIQKEIREHLMNQHNPRSSLK